MRYDANTAWYTDKASNASAELGQTGRDFILDHLRTVLQA